MVRPSVLASNAVARVFGSLFGLTKDYEIGIKFAASLHAALRSKS